MASTPSSSRKRRGTLLAIGGAEDPNEDDMLILPRVAALAGGKKARLLVCAAAAEAPGKTLKVYERVFRKIGVAEVTCMAVDAREQAHEARWTEAVSRATGVFFTGGDQLRLTSLIAGTPFGERLRERFETEGLLICGTSAGAAAMSSTMIIRGTGGTVRRSDVEMAPGLRYWQDSVIDTHFDRSGRVHRLMAVLAQNPSVLCVGLDEDTAVEVVSEEKLTVLGRGVVMIFDGRVCHLNTVEAGEEGPLALTGVLVHVLPAGYGFDLQNRRPIVPEAAPKQMAETSAGSS